MPCIYNLHIPSLNLGRKIVSLLNSTNKFGLKFNLGLAEKRTESKTRCMRYTLIMSGQGMRIGRSNDEEKREVGFGKYY